MTDMPERKRIEVASITLDHATYHRPTIMRSAYMVDASVAALVANTETGEPLAAFSVYLEGNPPAPGCIWVKTWAEGAGALAELERLGIVEATGRTAPAGWSEAAEARIVHEGLR